MKHGSQRTKQRRGDNQHRRLASQTLSVTFGFVVVSSNTKHGIAIGLAWIKRLGEFLTGLSFGRQPIRFLLVIRRGCEEMVTDASGFHDSTGAE